MRMVRERDAAAWPQWLETAKTTLLSRFAIHLARGQDAVLAALTLPWSNGQVEGQVQRLKLIKRSMYAGVVSNPATRRCRIAATSWQPGDSACSAEIRNRSKP